MDSISNIGFIWSKILVLQKCLRIVQMGLDKSPEAPSDRLLSVVVGLLFVSVLACFAFAIVAQDIEMKQSRVIGQLRESPQSTPKPADFPFPLSAYFSTAAVMFALATLSSLLYVWHTTFHLSRYLKSLQKDIKVRRLSEDEEPTDTAALSAFGRIKNFAMMSPIQKTVKTLSGNLRRLQLSVALIALSFLCKALLYVTLAFLFGLPMNTPDFPTNSTAQFVLDNDWCFLPFSSEFRIAGRTYWASPLFIPLFTLFCDIFLTMYAALSFPTHYHPHRLNQSTNQLKPHSYRCAFLFHSCAFQKPTASASRRNVQPTRCAGFRTTCRRAQRRSRATVPRSTSAWRLLSHASRSPMSIFLLAISRGTLLIWSLAERFQTICCK
jgi:ABC-type multidrug transport system fused ATPase/permease subunit